jgi:hypothetical protein
MVEPLRSIAVDTHDAIAWVVVVVKEDNTSTQRAIDNVTVAFLTPEAVGVEVRVSAIRANAFTRKLSLREST